MTKILVVDDSATSRLLFKAHMPKDLGVTVLEAKDLQGALAIALAQQPAMVFLDYNMPEKNGVEIAQVLQEQGVHAHYYLLTANTQESVLESAQSAGVHGVLEKPITADKLRNALEAVGL